MRPVKGVGALACAMLLGACSADKVLTVPDHGVVRLSLSTATSQQLGDLRSIDVRMHYLRVGGEAVTLGSRRLPADSAGRDVALRVDVTTCLRDEARVMIGSGAGCPIVVTVALLDASNRTLDSAFVGPLDGRPSEAAQPVTVSFRAPARVSLSAAAPTVLVGDTSVLAATLVDSAGNVLVGRAITWRSEDTTVVSVSPTGTLRARAPGRTVVTATRGEVRATSAVWVPAVRSLAVSPRDTALIATATHRLAAVLVPEPGRARTVLWRSSAPNVATVDDSGVVVARAPGTAVVTAIASADTGRTASVTVRVAPFQAVASFQRIQPFGDGGFPNNATAIWGARADRLYAVGNGLRLFDGTRWTAVGTDCCFAGVWGVGPDDLWLVGGSQATRYRNGTFTRFNTGVTGGLQSVWAPSADFAMAVGFPGTAARWDGTQWRAVPTGTTNPLWKVWGSSPTNVFAVGDNGTVLRWDGTAWSRMAFPTTGRIRALWGSDSANVYVGTRESPIQNRVYRLDGAIWREVATPPLQSVDAITGTSARDMYVVGAGTVLRGDGTTWTAMTLPDDMVGASNFSPYSAFATDGTVMIGGYDATTLVSRDGRRFETVSRSPVYRGLWAASPRDVFAVGLWGTIDLFDGERWTSMPSGTANHLFGVWGSARNDVYAVGAAGIALRWNGAAWQRITLPLTGLPWLWRVWGTDSSNVWIVGDGGVAVRRSGGIWRRETTPTTESLRSVWGTGPANVYAVGSRGAIVRWDGTAWRSMASPTTSNLWSVWGTGPDNVYAGGEQGTILRWDGSSWQVVRTTAGSTYFDIWGSGPDDVYAAACGDSSEVARFDGRAWARVIGSCAFGIAGFPSGGAYIGEAFRGILRGLGPRFTIGTDRSASVRAVGPAMVARPSVRSDSRSLPTAGIPTGSADGALPSRTGARSPDRPRRSSP